MTSVLILLSKVMVGKNKDNAVELEGADTIQWADSDPWVPIEIPGAVYVSTFQHIKPVKIEGTLTCYDYESMRKCLFETDIQTAEGQQYAVTETGMRYRIGYFHVTGLDQKSNPREYALHGVRIRNIQYPSLSKNEAGPQPFTIHFYAEYIEEA